MFNLFPLLSLIVSCLLGSRTCWWPLNFLAPCVRARAPCVTCCAAVVCACVITYVSSRCMSSLYVLSSYHIFSCSSDWLPVFGLRSGVLSGRLALAQLSFFLFSLCLLPFLMFSFFFVVPLRSKSPSWHLCYTQTHQMDRFPNCFFVFLIENTECCMFFLCNLADFCSSCQQLRENVTIPPEKEKTSVRRFKTT